MKEAVGLSRTYVCSYITFDHFFRGGGEGVEAVEWVVIRCKQI